VKYTLNLLNPRDVRGSSCGSQKNIKQDVVYAKVRLSAEEKFPGCLYPCHVAVTTGSG